MATRVNTVVLSVYSIPDKISSDCRQSARDCCAVTLMEVDVEAETERLRKAPQIARRDSVFSLSRPIAATSVYIRPAHDPPFWRCCERLSDWLEAPALKVLFQMGNLKRSPWPRATNKKIALRISPPPGSRPYRLRRPEKFACSATFQSAIIFPSFCLETM